MRVLMTKVHYKSSHDCNLGWCVMSLENILKKKRKKEAYSTIMLCIKCLRLVTFWLIGRNPSRRMVMYSRCHGYRMSFAWIHLLCRLVRSADGLDRSSDFELLLKSHVFNLQTLLRCSLPFLRPTWEEEAGLLGRSRWKPAAQLRGGDRLEPRFLVWSLDGREAFRVSAPSVHVCLSAGAVTIPCGGHTGRRREG